jgi:hypothetical protein
MKGEEMVEYLTRTDMEFLDGVFSPEAEFLDVIQTKVLRDFLLANSHLNSFALRFLFLQTHATSYSF